MPDLLFELLTEELPAKDVRRAASAVGEALTRGLAERGLTHGDRTVWFTPRRIMVFVADLAERSPDLSERVKGPPRAIAFSDDGAPTPAALGFARKNGVTVDELEDDGKRLWAVVRTAGRPASEHLSELLPTVPASAGWRKSMRWNVPGTFARPVRQVVALLGADVVPCELFGVSSGRTTLGHPFLAPGGIELARADLEAYRGCLREAFVEADPAVRMERVRTSVLEADADATVEPELLEEVTNLVEWPTALVGRFSESYLELPDRLLVTVMRHHQRFFPVRVDGVLAPRFVAVLNRTEASIPVARPGFERVLVPRLHDASFFLAEDRKRPLEDRLPQLEDVVYHRKLGSLRDKAARLEHLGGELADLLGLSEEERARAARAGRLAKCDLVTLMVGEFPELQGHVGAVYARSEGEHESVARALDLQYAHRLDGLDAPSGPALALLLAENLDVLCQFGANVKLPSGRADPFGVRRAALTFLDAVERWAPALPLARALDLAGGNDAVREYLDTRLRLRHRDRGVRADHLDAAGSFATVGELGRRLSELAELESQDSFRRLLEVAERCRNITKGSDASPGAVDGSLLVEPAEQSLHAAWVEVAADWPEHPRGHDVARLAERLAAPLHAFFEEVFVNDEDPAIRANRHALLLAIDHALLQFADLCRVVRAG